MLSQALVFLVYHLFIRMGAEGYLKGTGVHP